MSGLHSWTGREFHNLIEVSLTLLCCCLIDWFLVLAKSTSWPTWLLTFISSPCVVVALCTRLLIGHWQSHEPTTDLVTEALLLQGLVCGTVCRLVCGRSLATHRLGDIWKIIYLGFEKSQRSVTHDSLCCMNILTYLFHKLVNMWSVLMQDDNQSQCPIVYRN